LTGHQGECVYYEKPPQTNLKLLKANGAGIDIMLRYYAMVTEFGWQWLDRSDSGKSLYIIDLKGVRLTDFAGEVIDFVRKASAFTGAHYPERSGCIFIINVPSWFKSKSPL
jgi:CRAL/TRIO domain